MQAPLAGGRCGSRWAGDMAGQALRVAWYRFGVTFRHRWGGYLALAVLIGLTGGIAMSSMAAARRTYSSYPGFLAGTNPSDLVVQPFTTPACSPGLVRQLGRLPQCVGSRSRCRSMP
jgi:hypothetical protein